jgi:hypothetical protein
MRPPAMAPVAAPGGFTYMDVPQHPHLHFHEQMQMYPSGYTGPGPSCMLRRDSVLGCLCLWTDEEDAYETPVSASFLTDTNTRPSY